MSAIMGINGWPGWGHDASVAIIQPDSPPCLLEEERLVGVKHADKLWPYFALNKAFGIYRDNPTVVFAWDFEKLVSRDFSPERRSEVLSSLERFGCVHFRGFRHHLCHAATAVAFSNFSTCAVLIVDGMGEDEAISGWYFGEEQFHEVFSRPLCYSLGFLYEAASETIGFGVQDEGKTMCLAAFGQPEFSEELLRSFGPACEMAKDARRGWKDQELKRHWSRVFEQALASPSAHPLAYDSTGLGETRTSIAASVQCVLEQVLLEEARELVRRTGTANLCVAGGVAFNCRALGVLNTSGVAHELSVPPCAGDSGTSLGAALLECKTRYGKFPRIASPFLGIDAREDLATALETVRDSGFEITEVDDPEYHCARLLATGLIVAVCRERSEVGPRALGNRSILADLCTPDVGLILNRLKHRFPWQPFALSILEGAAIDIVRPGNPAPYMNMVGWVSSSAVKLLEPVAHADQTIRYQTVKPDSFLGRVITSGVQYHARPPFIINTSFNPKGLPICSSSSDAVRYFKMMELDALIIENFVVRSAAVGRNVFGDPCQTA